MSEGPSFFDLLGELREAHNRELADAMRGFLEDGFDKLDPGELSVRSIRCHELSCDRENLMRRLTEYYEDPPKRVMGGIEFGGTVSLMEVLAIIMYPNDCWTATDLYRRLMYLLGTDLDGKDG